ncbi:hypothetical protein V8C86DRAFT_1028097 [Haematococcus lacustris]
MLLLCAHLPMIVALRCLQPDATHCIETLDYQHLPLALLSHNHAAHRLTADQLGGWREGQVSSMQSWMTHTVQQPRCVDVLIATSLPSHTLAACW